LEDEPLRRPYEELHAENQRLREALRERDRLIAIQVAYQCGERDDGVPVWEWPDPVAETAP
jgi:hypothetical protein